jgi:hypothetical protein
LYIEKSRRHQKVSLHPRRNAIGLIRSQSSLSQRASTPSKFVTLVFHRFISNEGALKPRQTRLQKPLKKSEKIFKKKLATTVAIGLDRALQGQMGLSSVQKKKKKKLVRIQEV